MTALLAGDVDFMFDALSISARRSERAGSAARSHLARAQRDVPRCADPRRVGLSRVRGERVDRRYDHRGTPQAVIARLEAELRRILSDRELIAAFEKTWNDGELRRRPATSPFLE